VCELITVGASGFCVKNADGSTGANLADCVPGDIACEKDYFPPATVIYPSGPANRVDYLNIRVYDKTTLKGATIDKTTLPSYVTKMCIVTQNNSCNNASAFPISITNDQLIVHNLELKRGTTVIAPLALGYNTIKFFTEDPSNNLEVVKNLTFFACDNCAGPILINVSISTGGMFHDDLYTSDASPIITFNFDEPANVGFVKLMKAGTDVSIPRIGSGFSDSLVFEPIQLSGQYTLTLNAFNDEAIYLDAPLEYELYVTTGSAMVTTYPEEGDIINKTAIILSLNFSIPVTLENVSLLHDDFSSIHARVVQRTELTNNFSTTDDKSFTYSLTQLSGTYTLVIDAKGANGLDIHKEVKFYTSSMTPKMRLLKPSFGVSAYADFDVIVETSLPADCKYSLGTPNPPAQSQFQFLTDMQGTKMHTASNLNMPLGKTSVPLHVLCDFTNKGIITNSFNISLDSIRPILLEAYALPRTISEQYYPNQSIYMTTLFVEMNKEGFCKYSSWTSNFDYMEGEFPGFNISAKRAHSADVNVSQKGSYEYYVICKALNNLETVSDKILFNVDTTLDFEVTSSTPDGFSTTNISLGVVSNKRSICYYSDNNASITTPMGNGIFGFTHRESTTVSGTGKHTFYIDCYSTSNQLYSLIIPVYVDTTKPTMLYVDDTSQLQEDPDISWYTSKLRVSYKGEDQESGIDHYSVSLFEKDNDSIILVDDAVMGNLNGTPIFVSTRTNGAPLNLKNDTWYQFSVKAVNKLGLISDEKDSDGVLIDTSRIPPQCSNFVKDGDETDVDCGGLLCEACDSGSHCLKNTDCDANFCYQQTCKDTYCNDTIKNGWESDIDCGGSTCAGCSNSKKCVADSDCASNYCNDFKKCDNAPACQDGQLTLGETDIDCGGPCTPCGEGKNCKIKSDCVSGLSCDIQTATCTSTPGLQTPGDPWQTFSLNDGISDGWRMKYFGCIDCSQASPTNDADDDGLTNLQEYERGTNPAASDTDNDGWSDGKEIKKGYDPLNPESHPTSFFGLLFKAIIWLLIIGLVVFAGVWLYANRDKFMKRQPTRQYVPPVVPTKREEIEKLRDFAKKEDLDGKEWLPLKRVISKKPIPKKDFDKELQKLRKVAHIRRDLAPLDALKEMLTSLPSDAVQELKTRYRLMTDGILSKSEVRELLAKLKITSDYYEVHKKEFDRELENYGKKH
jgi:hypothetical protein